MGEGIEFCCDTCENDIRAADALSAMSCEGWKMVPVEPTYAMIAKSRLRVQHARDVWMVMLAAAPSPPLPANRETLSASAEGADSGAVLETVGNSSPGGFETEMSCERAR